MQDAHVNAFAHIWSVISSFLETNRKMCPQHGLPITGLTSDPFAAEIYGTYVLVDNCPECLYQSAQDI